MKPSIRIHADKNVITDAQVEIRTENAEGYDVWTDIRHAVTSISWDVKVGSINAVTLGIVPAEVHIEGLLSDQTYEAFAEALRLRGWRVESPETARDLDVTVFGSPARSFRPVLKDLDAEDRSIKARTL